jgi:bacterial/archaeal transporter family protein
MNASVVLGGILLLILWGVYGIAAKFAVREIGLQVLFWSPVVWLLLLPANILIFKELWPLKFDNLAGVGWAVGAALLGVSGTVVFYWLLRDAPASVVIPISALYPVVTVVLAFLFLHEELNPLRIIGIALAVIAIWLLSS